MVAVPRTASLKVFTPSGAVEEAIRRHTPFAARHLADVGQKRAGVGYGQVQARVVPCGEPRSTCSANTGVAPSLNVNWRGATPLRIDREAIRVTLVFRDG